MTCKKMNLNSMTYLTTIEQDAYDDLKAEAVQRRDNWFCNDCIPNGD